MRGVQSAVVLASLLSRAVDAAVLEKKAWSFKK